MSYLDRIFENAEEIVTIPNPIIFANTVEVSGEVVFSGGMSVGTALTPDTNDGAVLGSASLQWSDLFLASGAVINFNNGNVTLTHSAGALGLSAALAMLDDQVLTLGTTVLTDATKITAEFDEDTTGIGILKMGSVTVPMVLNANPGEAVVGFTVNILHDPSAASDCNDLIAAYNKVAVSGDGDAGLTIVGHAARAYVGVAGVDNSVVDEAYGSQPWAKHEGTGAIVAMSALSAKLDVSANNFTVSGTINAGHFHIEGEATVTGQFDGILVEVYGDVTNLDAGVRVQVDGVTAVTNGFLVTGVTTYGLNIEGTPATADIVLHNGATIMNGAAGTLDITEATITLVGSTGVTMTTGAFTVQPAAAGNAVINLLADAGAHLTITQTNGAGVTFLSTSDGTAGFLFDGGIVTLDGGTTLDNTTSADILNITEGTITLTGATKINLDGPVDISGALVLDTSATTGLSMTGTYINGIDFSNATLTQAVDNALFSIGSISGAKTVDIDASYIPFQIKLESTTNPGEQISMGAAYMSNAITTLDQANLQLATLMVRTTLNYNCYDAYGVQSHLTVKGDSTANVNTANVTPGSFKLTVDSGKTLTASASGILVTMDGAGTVTGEHSGIWVDAVADCDYGLRMSATGTLGAGLYMTGDITYALNFGANGAGIVHGGAAAANVAGYVKVKVGATAYRIPYLLNSDA